MQKPRALLEKPIPLQNVSIAVNTLKHMHGGSQSRLVLDTLGQPWILKLRHNPQHANVVFNECLGTYIAKSIGLNVPSFSLMTADSLGGLETASTTEPSKTNFSQLHFASSFVGYSPFGKTVDRLSAADLKRVLNLHEFAGILALDLWLSNTDSRQAVFMQQGKSRRFMAYWIDFGNCFEGSVMDRKFCRDSACYEFIRSLNDFDPWLSAIEALAIPQLAQFIRSMPSQWLVGRETFLSDLLSRLSQTQGTLRYDVHRFVEAHPRIFTGWDYGPKSCA
jgi:hypothetical protein